MLQSVTILSKLCFACDKKQLEFEGGREGGTGPTKVQTFWGIFFSLSKYIFSGKRQGWPKYKFLGTFLRFILDICQKGGREFCLLETRLRIFFFRVAICHMNNVQTRAVFFPQGLLLVPDLSKSGHNQWHTGVPFSLVREFLKVFWVSWDAHWLWGFRNQLK